MKIYQVSRSLLGKTITMLVIADDDFDMKSHYRSTATVRKQRFIDLRKKQGTKIEVQYEDSTN